jgi:hypothetical protein
MTSIRTWLCIGLALLASTPASAAEIAVATLAEGEVRLLRGTTWYKLPAGTRIEDGDILSLGERAQLHLELPGGTVASVVGTAALYAEPLPAKPRPGASSPPSWFVRSGWMKVAARPPGVKLRTASADVTLAAGTVVMRTGEATLDLFIESGSARFEAAGASPGEPAREGRTEEFWTRSASGALLSSTRPPKAFVDAMPRHYVDPLPVLASRVKGRPALTAEREVSYEEAEPWLAGRDRAVFERRFASRLRDPVFRRAVEPDVARYPMWDRRLHPEKYAPPPPKPPVSVPPPPTPAKPSAS